MIVYCGCCFRVEGLSIQSAVDVIGEVYSVSGFFVALIVVIKLDIIVLSLYYIVYICASLPFKAFNNCSDILVELKLSLFTCMHTQI